jgi:hypothetical protein
LKKANNRIQYEKVCQSIIKKPGVSAKNKRKEERKKRRKERKQKVDRQTDTYCMRTLHFTEPILKLERSLHLTTIPTGHTVLREMI